MLALAFSSCLIRPRLHYHDGFFRHALTFPCPCIIRPVPPQIIVILFGSLFNKSTLDLVVEAYSSSLRVIRIHCFLFVCLFVVSCENVLIWWIVCRSWLEIANERLLSRNFVLPLSFVCLFIMSCENVVFAQLSKLPGNCEGKMIWI